MARGTKHFYVVRCGRTPGIYRSWLECNEQVAGFSEAIYKGFKKKPTSDSKLRRRRIATSTQ